DRGGSGRDDLAVRLDGEGGGDVVAAPDADVEDPPPARAERGVRRSVREIADERGVVLADHRSLERGAARDDLPVRERDDVEGLRGHRRSAAEAGANLPTRAEARL